MKNEAEEEPTFLFNNELIARLLPRDLTLFNYLVGGLNPNKPRKDKFLTEPSKRTIYKILSKQVKGFNEARFYHEVFCENGDPILTPLRDFLPAYRGLFHKPESGQFFIAMEIVQFGMENPNSMDVKLGCQSYLPDAPSKKRNMEESKYLWRRQLGFFITGLNVDGSFYDRNHGSSLNPANVYEKGICLFLDGKEENEEACRRRRSLLGRRYAERISSLKVWFEKQRTYRFVASSLFFCYDWRGSGLESVVRFHLIDFARWYRVSDTECGHSLDENCLWGLRKLHSLFEQAAAASLHSS